MGCAGYAARLTLQHGAGDAAREADRLRDARDGADLREVPLVTGDEQDAFFAVRVDREGDVHGWENDCVFKRNQKKSAHVASNLIRWLSSQQAHPCQEI